MFFLLFAGFYAKAQHLPDNICHVNNGKLVFTINLNWTDEQIHELSQTYELDSTVISSTFKELPSFTVNGIVWTTKIIKNNIIELSKELSPPFPPSVPANQIMKFDIPVLDENWIKKVASTTTDNTVYGINNLTNAKYFSYINDTATFFLYGYTYAREMFISGSFNNWSTRQSAMALTDSGWRISLTMKPGKYAYKFIADGNWLRDPNNKLKENDTYGGNNSIVFCYNYTFRLKGYTQAGKVILTGSFNNWNTKELKMQRNAEGWELPIFLKEGTHAYKFIVDKEWITDPDNKIIHSDGKGNVNSFIGIGDTLVFRLQGYQNALRVALTGSFNGWNPNELFMEKINNEWVLPYVMAAGNHEYKFCVDGKWITDPDNPVTIGKGDMMNSVIAFKPNYTFKLNHYADAREVIVTGSFNGWRTDGYRMKFINGIWEIPVFLAPGKYIYKFIVDGKWITDPDNQYWEGNEYNTGNSVLWIEP
ncbi:MAG: glycogen-binding domain-containing protein [Lentimicrobiaceae bacterium]|nr:glycogen-binding domain-containing protein [Lentimicrobiaceae bacterium]